MFRAFLITYEWILIYASKIKFFEEFWLYQCFNWLFNVLIEIIMILDILKPLNSIFIFSWKRLLLFMQTQFKPNLMQLNKNVQYQ